MGKVVDVICLSFHFTDFSMVKGNIINIENDLVISFIEVVEDFEDSILVNDEEKVIQDYFRITINDEVSCNDDKELWWLDHFYEGYSINV